MNIYNARMRLFSFLWFSMKLGVINSFLIVCFCNGFKSFQVGEYLQNLCKKKKLHNGYKTTFIEKCVKFTINTRENFTNYFSPGVGRLQWLLYARIW